MGVEVEPRHRKPRVRERPPYRRGGSSVVVASILWGALLVGFTKAASGGAEERVPDEKRAEVLRFLAARNEANYRKIETWKGSYRFVDRFPHRAIPAELLSRQKTADAKRSAPPNPHVQKLFLIREGVIEFAVDTAADRYWVSYREDGSKARLVTPDGKETRKPSPGYAPLARMAVVTADSAIETLPDVKFGPLPDFPEDPLRLGGKSGRLAERKVLPDYLRISDSTEIIDPRRFYAVGPRLLWQELPGYADQLDGKFGAEATAIARRDFSVARTGAPGNEEYLVRFKYTARGFTPRIPGQPTAVFRFCESAGFLPVEHTWYEPTGEVRSYRSWIYQEVDGIRIPKEFHFTMNGEAGDSRWTPLILDRHLVLAETRLNERIPAEQFSIEGVELAKGDRFVDRIEQKLYVHEGRELIPAAEYDPATAGGLRKRTGMYVLGASVLVMAFVGAMIARRAFRRRRVAA